MKHQKTFRFLNITLIIFLTICFVLPLPTVAAAKNKTFKTTWTFKMIEKDYPLLDEPSGKISLTIKIPKEAEKHINHLQGKVSDYIDKKRQKIDKLLTSYDKKIRKAMGDYVGDEISKQELQNLKGNKVKKVNKLVAKLNKKFNKICAPIQKDVDKILEKEWNKIQDVLKISKKERIKDAFKVTGKTTLGLIKIATASLGVALGIASTATGAGAVAGIAGIVAGSAGVIAGIQFVASTIHDYIKNSRSDLIDMQTEFYRVNLTIKSKPDKFPDDKKGKEEKKKFYTDLKKKLGVVKKTEKSWSVNIGKSFNHAATLVKKLTDLAEKIAKVDEKKLNDKQKKKLEKSQAKVMDMIDEARKLYSKELPKALKYREKIKKFIDEIDTEIKKQKVSQGVAGKFNRILEKGVDYIETLASLTQNIASAVNTF